MGFFDTKLGVDQYVKMTQGEDGRDIIDVLKSYLPRKKSVLEVGMGPGSDLNILSKYYAATGSDASQLFVDRYKKKHRKANVLKLDATTLLTSKKFDAVYSNKVLHHLTQNELKKSIARQAQVLKKNGVICHTFWKGNKTMRMQGLLFNYYSIDKVTSFFGKKFDILEAKTYKECKKNDSFYLIARKK